MASNVNTELLIKEIEIKPLIWDSSCDDYNNKHKKKLAWFEICTLLIPDFKKETDSSKKTMIQDLISKWKIIRDTYVRYRKLKLKQLQTGAPAKKIREHTYVRELSFLNKIIDGNTTESNNDTNNSINDQVTKDNNSDCEIIDIKTLPNQNNSISTEQQNTSIPFPVEFIKTGTVPVPQNEIITPFPEDTARTDEPEIDFDMHDTAEYSNAANPLSMNPQINGAPVCPQVNGVSSNNIPYQKDEDLAFFYSLLPLVRSLNIDQKLAFRLQTLQLAQCMRNPPKVQVHTANNSNAQNFPIMPAIHLHLSGDSQSAPQTGNTSNSMTYNTR